MADPILLGIAAALALLVLLLGLVLRLQRHAQEARLDPVTLSAHVAASLQQSGVHETLGEFRVLAGDLSKSSRDLLQLFQQRQQRGTLGEVQLEEILSDVVPPDRLQIRKNVPVLGTPDAAIRTRGGLVCIDSKFPLDGFRDAMNGPESEREGRSRKFLRDVRRHVEDVATKYVRPGDGTAPYAVAFIPSEAVYSFVQQQEPALSREAAHRGVLLASPSTLTSHVALIVLGVQAEALSERAELIQAALQRLDREFASLHGEWDTLRRHVKNANEQGAKVEGELEALENAYRAAASLGSKGNRGR